MSFTDKFDKPYCAAEYERLKNEVGYGGVMVRVSPFNGENVQEAEMLMGRICSDKISDITEGDFLVFAKDYDCVANKLGFFLKEFSKQGTLYSVAADSFDANESFELFYRRIKRHIRATEISNMLQNR